MPGQTISLRIGLPHDPAAAQATLRHALAHVQAYMDEVAQDGSGEPARSGAEP